MISLVERNCEPAMHAVEQNRTAVNTGFDDLNAGGGARREKCQHALPLVGRTKAQTKCVLVLGLRAGLSGQATDLSWRPVISLADRGIETANATEPCRQGHLIHGQAGFIEQLLGKVQATSLHHSAGSGSEMLEEQTSKVA